MKLGVLNLDRAGSVQKVESNAPQFGICPGLGDEEFT